MVFQTVTVFARPLAGNDDWVIHHEVIDSRGNVVEQVAELAGSIFNFRITDEYVYSSQITPYGYYSFAFRHTNNYVVYHDVFSLFNDPLISQNLDLPRARSLDSDLLMDLSSELSSFIISNLDHYVSNTHEFTPVDVVDVLDLQENATETTFQDIFDYGHSSNHDNHEALSIAPFLSDRVHRTLADLQRNEFGAAFRNRLILTGGSTRNGVHASARVYQDYVVTNHPARRWQVRINYALTTISALLAISAIQLSRVVSVSLVAGGVILAAVNTVIGEHWVVEDISKSININGLPFSRASQQRHHHVVSGDLGFMINLAQSPGVVQQPSFFNQTSRLLTTSLDIWHTRGWFLCWYQ